VQIVDEFMFLNKEELKAKLAAWTGVKGWGYKILLQQIEEEEHIYDYHHGVWECDEDKLRYRTINFFTILISILKVWHLGFILGMLFMSLRFLLLAPLKSVNLLSSNLQNLTFLFAFTFITLLSVVRYSLHYLYMSTYFWVFLNINAWSLTANTFLSLLFFF
jgi:hypothetical protein